MTILVTGGAGFIGSNFIIGWIETTGEAVVNLDWHNDMSRLILDINERIEAAADDRARGVIVRRLRRALEEER